MTCSAWPNGWAFLFRVYKRHSFTAGGSFIFTPLGTKITPSIAGHIADLKRKDIGEFANVMRHLGLDPTRLLEWGLGGPDGLVAIVDGLSGRSNATE